MLLRFASMMKTRIMKSTDVYPPTTRARATVRMNRQLGLLAFAVGPSVASPSILAESGVLLESTQSALREVASNSRIERERLIQHQQQLQAATELVGEIAQSIDGECAEPARVYLAC